MSELEFYSEIEMQREAFARILLTGQKKVGKSTAVYTTSPTPIVALNADGRDALMPAKRQGAQGLQILDVTSADIWRKGVDAAIRMALDGKCKTIVIDTFSILINHTLTLEYQKKFAGEKDKFAVWRAVLDDGLRYLHRLLNAPAHVIVICHVDPDSGHLTLNSSLKSELPSLISDIVHLEFRAKEAPARVFKIGPDASGLTGGRNSTENKVIPADVTMLLKELGYNV